MHLPVGDALLHVAGENHWLFEQQIAHPSDEDPHWAPIRFDSHVGERHVPTLLASAWFDTPLPGVCDDYRSLRAAGVPTALRIGAGGHLEGGGEGVGDALVDWFDAYLLDAAARELDAPVRVHVQGEGGWRDLADWPPPESVTTRWYLQPGGGLGRAAPETDAHAEPSRYRYDPADPTPAFGGTGLMTGGRVDNTPLEARDDVLVFTSDVLGEPLEMIGPVRAELFAGSSLDHTDFFVRVCDVDADGRSWNVCDGLQRFDPSTVVARPDGSFAAHVELWPIGYRFGVGHRVRVQVSSGAHPVYARNLGTGDPPATATAMHVADQAVFHDAARASCVVLPHFPG
jgi:putative CocE/NonD family hydrolase